MVDERTVKDPKKLKLRELIEIYGQTYKEYAGERKERTDEGMKKESN